MSPDWITILGGLWAAYVVFRLETISRSVRDNDDRITRVEYELDIRGD